MNKQNDLLTQPYSVIKRNGYNLYKFKNGPLVYTEEEFKAILKKNIEDTTNNEVKQETIPTSKKNKGTKPAKN